jgi:hypothetical protein
LFKIPTLDITIDIFKYTEVDIISVVKIQSLVKGFLTRLRFKRALEMLKIQNYLIDDPKLEYTCKLIGTEGQCYNGQCLRLTEKGLVR